MPSKELTNLEVRSKKLHKLSAELGKLDKDVMGCVTEILAADKKGDGRKQEAAVAKLKKLMGASGKIAKEYKTLADQRVSMVKKDLG